MREEEVPITPSTENWLEVVSLKDQAHWRGSGTGWRGSEKFRRNTSPSFRDAESEVSWDIQLSQLGRWTEGHGTQMKRYRIRIHLGISLA